MIEAIIEIPAQSHPIKYEFNKTTHTMEVDRFIATPMFYPVNYGYIPNTLADDGDPLDILVMTPYPIIHGASIQCRPIAILNMSDEKGKDEKVLAVPISKLTQLYDHIIDLADIPTATIQQLEHFFTHYKDLEKGKWVKIDSWEGKQQAIDIIKNTQNKYLASK